MKSLKQVLVQPLVTVRDDETVADVYRVMSDYNCRHVPVVNSEGELIGIVSDRDVLRALLREGVSTDELGDQQLLLEDHPVVEVMSTEPETIDVEQSIEEACAMMFDNQFDCLPVLDAGRLVGIVTSMDMLRILGEGTQMASGESGETASMI